MTGATYVVKQGDAYVHYFTHEGVPAKAVAEWETEQKLAWRWEDRNGAAAVARDVRGRVVRLVTSGRSAK